MFAIRTVSALALILSASASFAAVDACNAMSGKTQCVSVTNSLGQTAPVMVAFNNGLITAPAYGNTTIGSYSCKGNSMGALSLLLNGQAAVVYGKAITRGTKFVGYGADTSGATVFSWTAGPCMAAEAE